MTTSEVTTTATYHRPAKRRKVEGFVRRADGTLRGLASGVITSGSTQLRPCVVFGHSYPCWLPALKQMGCKPVLVVVRDGTYLSEIEHTVPDECAIWIGKRWDVLGIDPFQFKSRPTIAFVDGVPSREVLDLSILMKLPLVYGTGTPRRVPKEWQCKRVSVDHHLVGGVSRSRSDVVLFVHGTATRDHIVRPSPRVDVPRDLSTLLYDMTELRPRFSRLAEPDANLGDYDVRDVSTSTSQHAVYHGGGWLPSFPRFRTWVKTPSVYFPPSRWAVRPLLREEYLAVYDWSDAFIKVLGPSVHEPTFPKRIHPVKSLVAGVLDLKVAAEELLGHEGGASTAPSSSSSEFLAPVPSTSISPGSGLVASSGNPLCFSENKMATPEIFPRSSESDPNVTGNLFACSTTKSSPAISEIDSAKGESSRSLFEQANVNTSLPGENETLKRPSSTCIHTENPEVNKRRKRNNESSNATDDEGLDVDELLDNASREKRERKATKSDDAQAPIYLWTEHYLESSSIDWKCNSSDENFQRIQEALETLRSKLFIWKWQRRLMKEFNELIRIPKQKQQQSDVKWLTSKYEQGRKTPTKTFLRYHWSSTGRAQYMRWYQLRKDANKVDYEPGVDAVQRACRANWWEWSDGSRPFHWRWPKWYQPTIRDGINIHLSGDIPRYQVPQSGEKNPVTKERVKEKLNKVRARRYIGDGCVLSLTSFFSVPKGEDDIRMVYDGTKSGLNAAMWVPRFALPTIETHLRAIEEGTFLADVDVGDCFLNFPLHSNLQALAGVDLTLYFPDPTTTRVWERWKRALMGVKSSPYQAVQGMMVAEEVIRGDPKQEWNVFKWTKVRLNCPGDPNYDPSKPWVSKIREDGRIAANLVGYVDDLRPSGFGRQETWQAARRTASVLNYLGIQDAARKRRDSSRTPGAWAGSVVVTRDDGVFVMSEKEKWLKAKNMIQEVQTMIRANPQRLDRKRLEQIRGFLIHVVRTYPSLKAYIMGLHLTIDGWRSNRDKEGWRLSDHAYELYGRRQHKKDDHGPIDHDTMEAPQFVEAKPRLMGDMVALSLLMNDEKPLLRRVRSPRGRKAVYSFGDASAAGFGRTLAIDGKVYYQFGQWTDEKEGKSSNWREAKNLLLGLERAAEDHKLTGLELFIFTDNTTAESAFWKGTSKSKDLAGIVLDMRKLEMKYDLIIHVIHVSGSRMIAQGTDGLSRADHSNGVMIGEAMTDFVPLNESALDRSTHLKSLLEKHLSRLNLQFLSEDDWFEERRGYGNYVWAPPRLPQRLLLIC